jgi:hypothetical protein
VLLHRDHQAPHRPSRSPSLFFNGPNPACQISSLLQLPLRTMRTVFGLLNIHFYPSNQLSRLTDINHNVSSCGPVIIIVLRSSRHLTVAPSQLSTPPLSIPTQSDNTFRGRSSTSFLCSFSSSRAQLQNRPLQPRNSHPLWRTRRLQRRILTFRRLLRPPALVQQTA